MAKAARCERTSALALPATPCLKHVAQRCSLGVCPGYPELSKTWLWECIFLPGQEEPGLVLRELREALQDGKRQVRAAAAEALGEMGKKASPAIPLLEEAAKDFFEDVQKAAVEALKAIGD